MSYHELKERFEKLQDTDFSNDYSGGLYKSLNLVEDVLAELRASERSLYLLKRSVPSEVSSFYPRITKDPTITCFKDNHLVGTYSLENPDFTKLYDRGLYALSEGEYSIRTAIQLGYISKFLEGEMKKVIGLEGYHFYINFD